MQLEVLQYLEINVPRHDSFLKRVMMVFAFIAGMVLSGFGFSAFADDAALPSAGVAPRLTEMVIGSENAPVTITEYASMTCTHCAAFHRDIYPLLKGQYIDAGKVRFVFREFPLDIKAAAGSMIARCVAQEEPAKYFSAIDLLFKTQGDWAFRTSSDGLQQIAKQMGLGEQEFRVCLSNTEVLNAIKLNREDAIAKLDVHSTPSLFVNGIRLEGAPRYEEIEKVIKLQLRN